MIAGEVNVGKRGLATLQPTFYRDLSRFKEAFTGGSECELVAAALDKGFPNQRHPRVLMDVGSSDCRYTAKILSASALAASRWHLITVDPDPGCLRRAPPTITRLQHLRQRFEQVDASELAAEPEVVLFSHSLYYFADPVVAVERAFAFTGRPPRIVISQWSDLCDIRAISSEISSQPGPAVRSGEWLEDQLKHLGRVTSMGKWVGGVDLTSWRRDRELARSVTRILATEESAQPDIERFCRVLDTMPASGRRVNHVFLVEPI